MGGGGAPASRRNVGSLVCLGRPGLQRMSEQSPIAAALLTHPPALRLDRTQS